MHMARPLPSPHLSHSRNGKCSIGADGEGCLGVDSPGDGALVELIDVHALGGGGMH